MSDRLIVRESAGAIVCRPNRLIKLAQDGLDPRGVFNFEHWRDGRMLHAETVRNIITTEGKNNMLDVQFHNTTVRPTWYIGLISITSYTAVAATDNYDGINAANGWTEFTSYTDPANANSATTRPAWTEGTAAASSITNASSVNFDITGTGTVKGLFLAGGTNAQTKSDSTSGSGNTLWCATLFAGGDRAVINLDQLRITYTISL